MANLACLVRIPRSMASLVRRKGGHYIRRGDAIYMLIEMHEQAPEGELPKGVEGGRAGCRFFRDVAEAREWLAGSR